MSLTVWGGGCPPGKRHRETEPTLSAPLSLLRCAHSCPASSSAAAEAEARCRGLPRLPTCLPSAAATTPTTRAHTHARPSSRLGRPAGTTPQLPLCRAAHSARPSPQRLVQHLLAHTRTQRRQQSRAVNRRERERERKERGTALAGARAVAPCALLDVHVVVQQCRVHTRVAGVRTAAGVRYVRVRVRVRVPSAAPSAAGAVCSASLAWPGLAWLCLPLPGVGVA